MIVERMMVDMELAKEIYLDGQWSNDGERIYFFPNGQFVCEPFSKWQGRDPEPFFMNKDRFIEKMRQSPHPERAAEALKMAGIDPLVVFPLAIITPKNGMDKYDQLILEGPQESLPLFFAALCREKDKEIELLKKKRKANDRP